MINIAIAVSRPQPANFEKFLMFEMSHNVYQNVLFNMQVALSKSNAAEQKPFLIKSLDYIKNSTEDEDKLKKIILENVTTIKIANHLLNLEEKGQDALQMPPLNLMVF